MELMDVEKFAIFMQRQYEYVQISELVMSKPHYSLYILKIKFISYGFSQYQALLGHPF